MYNYQKEKPKVFLEENQAAFLKIRDAANRLVTLAGSVTTGKLLSLVSGVNWENMALIDRLIELGEFREVLQRADVRWQDRILVK